MFSRTPSQGKKLKIFNVDPIRGASPRHDPAQRK